MHKYLKIPLTLVLLAALIWGCEKGKTENQKPWSIRMAQSEIKRNPSAWMLDFQSKPKWAYVNGLVCDAMIRLWESTGDEQYFNYVRTYTDSLIAEDGQISGYKKAEFNIDKINSGKILFALYDQTKNPRYKATIDILFDQLHDQPRTAEGGFWHKQIYPNQMWLDGIYMGTPFYARYAATFGVDSMFDDIALQFELLGAHARDSVTGWYYHGWDASKSVFWADSVTGLSQNFWARGVGWYYMALIDVLDYFPANHPKRSLLISQFVDLSKTIVGFQDTAGLWYQVPNFPNRPGNYHEATASAMFTYGLMKGVDKGLLNQSYIAPAMKGFNGIIRDLIKVHEDGELELIQCCAGAGLGPADNPVRDGTYEYYIEETIRSNDGKGTGPFIMAALILENSQSFKGQAIENK